MTDSYEKRRDAFLGSLTGEKRTIARKAADWGRADAKGALLLACEDIERLERELAESKVRIQDEVRWRLQGIEDADKRARMVFDSKCATIERLERELAHEKAASALVKELYGLEEVERLTAENAELKKGPFVSGTQALHAQDRLREAHEKELAALRAERDDMKAHIDQCERNLIDTQRERDELRAENERLRNSLVTRDEKDVQIEKLRAQCETLHAAHETNQAEHRRVWLAEKAARAIAEKLAGALSTELSGRVECEHGFTMATCPNANCEDAKPWRVLAEYAKFKEGI